MKKWLKVLLILAVAVPGVIYYQNADAAKLSSAALHIDHSKYCLSSTLPDLTIGATTAIILQGGSSEFVNVDLAVYGGKENNSPMAIILLARAPQGFDWVNNITGADKSEEIIGNMNFQAATIVVDSKEDAFSPLDPKAPTKWLTRRYVSDTAGSDNTIVLEYREPLAAQASGLSENPQVPSGFNERANKAFIGMPSSIETISMKGHFVPNIVKEQFIQYALPSLSLSSPSE